MLRTILVYGAVSGLVAIVSVIASIALGAGESYQENLEWLGYLIMLVALSMIFVAIKQYRDRELGGIITFGKAFLVGIGIAALAGVVYTIVWEIYLAMTDYTFIHEYTQSLLARKQASGVSGAELQALQVDAAMMVEHYANPLFRLPITFLEIFPVGFLIALLSAAILRKRDVMPTT